VASDEFRVMQLLPNNSVAEQLIGRGGHCHVVTGKY
jgi:hypothetical protein